MTLELVNPAKIWDKFICDSCHRFLSVGPIRLYPNKIIKCGRCSKNDSYGISASFSFIGRQFAFKCVNRFDGCRKLLLNNQVEEHEKNCLSKNFMCPLCPENNLELPTFLFLTHFKEVHKRHVLEKPWIFVNLEEGEFRDVNKLYLYNIDDHLLFITFKLNWADSTLFLSSQYVGDAEKANKVMQKYSLYSKNNNSELKTESISCDCFGSPRPKGISVKRSKFQSNNFIILVELDLEEIESLEMPLYNMKMVDTGDFVNLQRIFLSPDFLNSNPKYSIDISGTSLVIKENDYEKIITFQCCICFVKLGLEINVIQSSNKSFCSFCVEYYKARKPNSKIDKFTIPSELLRHLKFFCKWNCNELIPYIRSSIFHEENVCSLQPSKNCPVESCVFEGKLYELQNHFIINHKDSNLKLDSYITHTNIIDTKSTSQHNAFGSSKTHSTGIFGSVATHGSHNKEIKKFSYFFVQNTFVLLKKLDEPERNIFFIDYCNKEDANNDFQPAVIVLAPTYIDAFRTSFVQRTMSENTLSMNVILEKVSP